MKYMRDSIMKGEPFGQNVFRPAVKPRGILTRCRCAKGAIGIIGVSWIRKRRHAHTRHVARPSASKAFRNRIHPRWPTSRPGCKGAPKCAATTSSEPTSRIRRISTTAHTPLFRSMYTSYHRCQRLAVAWILLPGHRHYRTENHTAHRHTPARVQPRMVYLGIINDVHYRFEINNVHITTKQIYRDMKLKFLFSFCLARHSVGISAAGLPRRNPSTSRPTSLTNAKEILERNLTNPSTVRLSPTTTSSEIALHDKDYTTAKADLSTRVFAANPRALSTR